MRVCQLSGTFSSRKHSVFQFVVYLGFNQTSFAYFFSNSQLMNLSFLTGDKIPNSSFVRTAEVGLKILNEHKRTNFCLEPLVAVICNDAKGSFLVGQSATTTLIFTALEYFLHLDTPAKLAPSLRANLMYCAEKHLDRNALLIRDWIVFKPLRH